MTFAAALALIGLNAPFYTARGVATGALQLAPTIVCAAFLLLMAGAALSWHKQALQRLVGAAAIAPTEQTPTSDAAGERS